MHTPEIEMELKPIDIIVMRGTNVDEDYTKKAREIADYARNDLHLDFDDVEFRIVDQDRLAEMMALYDEPFPSWYAGQTYDLMKNEMRYGYFRLYESVWHKYYNPLKNKNYDVIYLNNSNSYSMMLAVIAHVYGHLHFDKHNALLSSVDVPLLNEQKSYMERFRVLESIIGEKRVEEIYDIGKTLVSLSDLYPEFRDDEKDDYYNSDKESPTKDEYDVFKFFIENGRFNKWEQELLYMMHKLYLGTEKNSRVTIMNEGFASFVEEKYATHISEEDMNTSLRIAYGVYSVGDPKAEGQLRYALGLRLFKYLEEKYDKGKHGPIYEKLSYLEKESYDAHEGRGLEKVLQAVNEKDDWSFIFSYADTDFLKSYLTEAGYSDIDEAEGTPSDFKLNLLLSTGNYKPIVYIPRGGANFKGGLLLEQDLSFLNKYLGMSNEEAEATLVQNAEMLTLDNSRTHKALHRMAKAYGHLIFLRTMDPETGKPMLLISDGNTILRDKN